jgi:hypothetical protein
MAGQVAYHLLAQAGTARAPWPVTTIVSCLPILVLAMGTTLAHMLHADATPGSGKRGPAADQPSARSYENQAGPSPDQTASAGTPAETGPPARTATVPRQDHRPGPRTNAPGQTETNQARLIANRLAAAGKPVSRRALRSRGIRGSNLILSSRVSRGCDLRHPVADSVVDEASVARVPAFWRRRSLLDCCLDSFERSFAGCLGVRRKARGRHRRNWGVPVVVEAGEPDWAACVCESVAAGGLQRVPALGRPDRMRGWPSCGRIWRRAAWLAYSASLVEYAGLAVPVIVPRPRAVPRCPPGG